ncbi:MAG TPA: hypothetical protein VIU02_11480 [Burkholderiales bacterium]
MGRKQEGRGPEGMRGGYGYSCRVPPRGVAQWRMRVLTRDTGRFATRQVAEELPQYARVHAPGRMSGMRMSGMVVTPDPGREN